MHASVGLSLSICLSTYWSLYLSASLFICLCKYLCLFVYLSIYLSLCLSIYLYVSIYLCLSIYMSVCLLLGITRFLDFVRRPVFYKLENTTFRKLGVFPSSGEGGGETPTLLGPLQRASLNHPVVPSVLHHPQNPLYPLSYEPRQLVQCPTLLSWPSSGGMVSHVGHDRFLPKPFQFPSHPTVRCCVLWRRQYPIQGAPVTPDAHIIVQVPAFSHASAFTYTPNMLRLFRALSPFYFK
jgi:hypothetical protein